MADELSMSGAKKVKLVNFFENEDYSKSFKVYNKETKLYTDFTGCTFAAEFRKDITSVSPDFSLANSDFTVSSDGTEVTWALAKTKTATKGGENYFFSFQYTDTGLKTRQLFYGTAKLENRAVI